MSTDQKLQDLRKKMEMHRKEVSEYENTEVAIDRELGLGHGVPIGFCMMLLLVGTDFYLVAVNPKDDRIEGFTKFKPEE